MGGLVGGVMDGLFGSAQGMPAIPDYQALAKQTAESNRQAAEAATKANRTGATNQAGQASWKQDPITGQWTQSTELSDPLKNSFNTAQGNLDKNLGNNLSYNAGDPNLIQQNVSDALYNQQKTYLDPQFQQSQSSLENKLANQGITQGSEAYNNAMLNASNAKEQAYGEARNSAIGKGVSAAQGMFGMNLSNANLNNQATNQGLNNSMTSMNGMFGLAPNAGQYKQQDTGGVDYSGASANQYNAEVGQVNANNAARDNMIGGITGIAGSVLGGPIGGMIGSKIGGMFGSSPGTMKAS